MPVFLNDESRTGWYVIIDKQKLENQDNLEIEVPKQLGLEEIFRGKNSWQERAWKERLELEEIKVVGVWFIQTQKEE